MSEAFPTLLPERLLHSTLIFASSLVMIPAYLLVVRMLLQHLTKETPASATLLGRGIFIVLAFQVWLLVSDLFHEFSPIQEGYTHLPKEPWGILSVIVPIVIAYGSYRLATAILNKAQQSAARKPSAFSAASSLSHDHSTLNP